MVVSDIEVSDNYWWQRIQVLARILHEGFSLQHFSSYCVCMIYPALKDDLSGNNKFLRKFTECEFGFNRYVV